jgi:hypothetical protein
MGAGGGGVEVRAGGAEDVGTGVAVGGSGVAVGSAATVAATPWATRVCMAFSSGVAVSETPTTVHDTVSKETTIKVYRRPLLRISYLLASLLCRVRLHPCAHGAFDRVCFLATAASTSPIFVTLET